MKNKTKNKTKYIQNNQPYKNEIIKGICVIVGTPIILYILSLLVSVLCDGLSCGFGIGVLIYLFGKYILLPILVIVGFGLVIHGIVKIQKNKK